MPAFRTRRATRSAPPSAEITPLAERMIFLQVLRVTFACVVFASSLLAARTVGVGLDELSLPTTAYLLCAAGAEFLRRLQRRAGTFIVALMLLADGAYLAWATYATGGAESPLRFLPYVHLIAVTLVGSYRTGLKIALWHSLLFFVVFYAQEAQLIDPAHTPTGGVLERGAWERLSVFNVIAFWFVAISTAAFSWLNERELRRRNIEFRNLAAMAQELEAIDEPNTIAQVLLESLVEGFGFQRGAVLASRDGDLELLAHTESNDPPPPQPGRDAVVQRAMESRQPVLVKKLDPEGDGRLSRVLSFTRNVIVVPLVAEDKPLGVIALENPARIAQISRHSVDVVGQFAAHAALALRNAWLLDQVQKMAEVDALTGVANRHTFETTLRHEMSRAKRHGEPLTLVMIDVDHFKKLNDTHGHQVGDDVLQRVARALASRCRDFDTVARYGGEEFAVILPACSSRESLVAAERLRSAVSQMADGLSTTASAGVATYPTHAADPESLVRTADEALYESKRTGRDRVTRSRRRGSRRRVGDPEKATQGHL